jgi:pyruvate dehydrogenase E1 component alpha subunit
MTIESLFRSMLRIRRVEEAIAERYAEQEMRCPVHLSIGQEAVAVGVCAALRRSDGVFSGHRAHAHYLAKGGDLTAMLAEIYGRENGCCRGVGGSMHMVDLDAGFLGSVPIVGATVPLAVGAAWAARLRHEDRVITIFIGDGTFEEGVVHESINFAVLHKLPVLFVCENNLYACYTRLGDRQPDRPIHGVAAAHGCRTYTADGNDVQAIYDASREAIAGLRDGGAPAFIECATYRWREHCGPNLDDDLGYRPAGELADWETSCPVRRIAAQLRQTSEGKAFVDTAEREIAAEIAAAFDFALNGPLPQSSDLPGYVYA